MLLSDLRFAVRSLARTPLLTGVAVATLALGIGANTAIFSLANWTLLRGVPGVRASDRIAVAYLEERIPGFDGTMRPPLPASLVASYAASSRAAEQVAGEGMLEVQMGSVNGAPAERLHAMLVTSNYFALLGATPAAGRAFTPDEDRAGSAPSAIVSHRLWRRLLGGTAHAIGTTVVLNAHRFTVVGVAPEGFTGIDLTRENDVWLAAGAAPLVQRADERPGAGPQQASFAQVVLRLRAGVTEARARDEARRLLVDPGQAVRPGRSGPTAELRAGIGLSREMRARVSTTVALLMGGVALVLLIACANVANLLLVRGVTRRHELAIRTSLGADQWRLVRLFLAESAVIGVSAGALGLLVASWGTALLARVKISNALPQFPTLSPDARVLAFAAGVTLLVVLLVGLLPALAGARSAPAPTLRAGVTGEARRSRARGLLVVAQVATCFVLVAGAGLFVRTVRNLRAIDVGFRAEHVLAFALDLRSQGYAPAVAQSLVDRLTARLAARPDVEATAVSMSAPFALGGLIFSGIGLPGQAGPPAFISGNAVSPDYFKAIGMRFVRGRSFSPGATGDEIVVNEALARKLFPGRAAVGEQVSTGGGGRATIVGVVPDAKLINVREDASPTFYQPFQPELLDHETLIVRSTTPPDQLVPAIRRAVAEIDPNLPMFDVMPLDSRVRASLAEQYASAWLVSLFGSLGVALAAVGLYGMLAFGVTQRLRELALRVALGARADAIRTTVVGEGARLALAGVAIGAAATAVLARLVASRLYGVSPFDAATMAGAAAGVLAIAVVASWLPARRATRVDPMLVLRGE